MWSTRYPEGGSVHLLEWPELPEVSLDAARWEGLRAARTAVNEQIEPMRREKVIGSSLEAAVTVPDAPGDADLAELFIVSSVASGAALEVTRTAHHKCGRCWRHQPEVTVDGALCSRCDQVVAGMDAGA